MLWDAKYSQYLQNIKHQNLQPCFILSVENISINWGTKQE